MVLPHGRAGSTRHVRVTTDGADAAGPSREVVFKRRQTVTARATRVEGGSRVTARVRSREPVIVRG